jgi:hypothetical protein
LPCQRANSAIAYVISLEGEFILRSRFTILLAVSLLSACTAIENDLSKGLAYGSDPERLTRKVDEKHSGRAPSGVNAYLWRAAMDTVGTIPLVKSDPRSGQIETDWHSAPSDPDERTKLLILVLDDDLRRDTLRVSVARQIWLQRAWTNAPAQASAAQRLEELILTKARDLHRR